MESATKGKAKRRHLGAEDCLKLLRSTEGTSALTQPHTVRWMNQALVPRLSNKRLKPGVASAARPQNQKAAGPCSSSRPPAPKELLKPQPEDEDSGEFVSHWVGLVNKEEEDYVKGMMTEKFCIDENFDNHVWSDGGASTSNQLGSARQVVEEVEPLPDAYYGLLGTGRGLVEPQGSIESLPEEVLRMVLRLLPASDLYRHASLVCRRWRHVIQDPKFVPHRKGYYRYLRMEENAVEHITSILKVNHMLHTSTTPRNPVLQLVCLMACSEPSEGLRLERLLQCVKRHRLFPQAEACVCLRRTNIQIPIGPGIKGPNPYAIMAVMLLLSEGVEDVWSLVSHLKACMSTCAIKENLSQMATLLLAMMRNRIQISNRIHYNIFHVLHLMENCPSAIGTSLTGRQVFDVTYEQQQILRHDIQRDHVVKIIGFAGTGKTSTLVRYAQQRPHVRFLYVIFNTLMATEAQRRFPGNVACRTLQSMAFQDVGSIYQIPKKLTAKLNPLSICEVLPEGSRSLVNAQMVATTLETYIASADRIICRKHVPNIARRLRRLEALTIADRTDYIKDAKQIWEKMKNPSEVKKDAYKITPEGILKLWQLREPKPYLTLDYDVILIDDAHDCTQAILDVLLSQPCGKIIVGDPHQQTSTFEKNTLLTTPHTHLYHLTQSFRFGAEIAYIAATILQVTKGATKILVGGKQEGSVWGEKVDFVPSVLPQVKGQTAILSLCIIGVFNEAVRLSGANPRCRLHMITGTADFGLRKILDIWHLANRDSNPEQIQDAFIRSFCTPERGGYQGLRDYAERTADWKLKAVMWLIRHHSYHIPELVARLCSAHVDDHRNADFILGTVDMVRRLEFDTVVICDDFVNVHSALHGLDQMYYYCLSDRIPEVEWNMLYVAVTRAKTNLVISRTIGAILKQAGEYCLKSETTSSLMTKEEAPRCCIEVCHKALLPDSAFIMSKRTVNYVDGVDHGGPLCERCLHQYIGPAAHLLTDKLSSTTTPVVQPHRDGNTYYEMLRQHC